MDISDRIIDIENRLSSLVDKAELWHLIIDECPWAVMCFDSSFTFFMINKSFTELTGYAAEEIVGKKMDYVIPREHRRDFEEYMTKFVNKEKKRSTDPAQAYIVDAQRKKIPVDADLSYFVYLNNQYYIAYVRKTIV